MADLGGFLSAAGVGSAIGQAVVQLELNTAKYNAELEAAQGKTVASTQAMGQSTSKFSNLASTAFLGLGIAAGAFAVASVKAFTESQKVMAQTEAVLKSTGGQANVTKDQILGLADQLRDLTGVDNDAIQASENLLLTFRDVKNEVGEGNDIFNQAETAIVDMATAMNEGAVPSMDDLHTSTIQLGKALNDPIKGMTALRRVGVSFNESQVETITRLQESGDLMGAQKVILGELTKEFGGAGKAAGETFAGKMAILSSKFQDIEEQVGEALIPAIEGFADTLTGLLPILTRVADAIKFLPIVQMGEDFDSNASRIVRFGDALVDTIPILGSFVSLAGDETDALGRSGDAMENHLGVVQELSQFYRGQFTTAIEDSNKAARQAGRTFAGLGDDLQEWSDDTKEAFDSYVLSLEESEDAQADTARGFKAATQDMLEDARALSRAMKEIAQEKWVNEEYVKFLSEQGPEWMIGFSKLTEEQQHKAQNAWQLSTDKTEAAKGSLDKIIGALDDLAGKTTKHKVEVHYSYEGFDPSKPGMSNNTPSETRPP